MVVRYHHFLNVARAVIALQPCFLLDSMLGRLCRWLRALGVDAEFVETGSKQQLQQAARSEGQQQQLQSLERQQQNQLIETIHNTALQEVCGLRALAGCPGTQHATALPADQCTNAQLPWERLTGQNSAQSCHWVLPARYSLLTN